MTTESIGYSIIRSAAHFLNGHPEDPSRFDQIDRFLQGGVGSELVHIETSRQLTDQELSAVHALSYLQGLQRQVARGQGFLDYGDTYCTPESYESAVKACSACVGLLQSLLDGRIQSGFGIVRPPGHHATEDRALGFCLLNNVAITARHAQQMGCQKIFIVDFDVHHGNGTNDIFYSDPDVFYLSTHQWGIFPGSGKLEEIGRGAGEFRTMNLPLPSGSGSKAMHEILQRLILPAVNRFEPELILVSAGFDAHWRDPLASLQLCVHDYYHLARELHRRAKEICSGRILFLLEGGYDVEVLSYGVRAVFSALGGHPFQPDPVGESDRSEPDVSGLIEKARRIHSL